MQVNNINSTQNFGTKCMIGEFSARLGLRNCDENITKSIYQALKKLSKNKANDTLVLSLGTNGKTADTILNLSYFDGSNKCKSFIYYNLKNLENINTLSKKGIKKLITSGYKVLAGKTDCKASKITQLPICDTNIQPSKKNLAMIEKLIKKFGFDDSSLLH
ncbi:MAG: hypothetical protein MJ229_07070 [bacterium]|nr:hypothetical protein [bacterium]